VSDAVVVEASCCCCCWVMNHNDLAVSVRTVSRACGTGTIGRGVLTLGGDEEEAMVAIDS